MSRKRILVPNVNKLPLQEVKSETDLKDADVTEGSKHLKDKKKRKKIKKSR